MSGYQGNIIIKNPATPAGPYEDGAAPGVWTLSEAMTFVKQGVWPTAGLIQSDPYFKNVSLLLHGNGTNGAQNNTFIDSSANGLTITRNGNTTQGSFSPYGSNWSNYFDGSGDYISAPSNAALDCGTGDWTFECWVFVSTRTTNYPLIFGNNRGGFTTDALAITASNSDSGGIYQDRFVVAWGSYGWSSPSTGNSALLVANTANSNNTWYHLALVRNGTSVKMYRNGVEVASATVSSGATFNWGYTNALLGGGNWDGAGGNFNGYISNARLLKGTALYTAAFTPSTTPLTAITNTSLLTCAYNRFRDGSTNNFTITRNGDVKVTNFAPFAPSSAYSTTTNGGSAYFDTDDYLNTAFSSAFSFGSGDFTWEAWVFPQAGFDAYFISFLGEDDSWAILGNTGGSGRLEYLDYFDLSLVDNTYSLQYNAWNHIAVTRSSGTVRLYNNGVLLASGTGSRNYTANNKAVIGARPDGYSNRFKHMSDVRILKGTALYTGSTYTVPTSPVSAVTNTQLLLNATNAAIFDNSMKNDLETVGNAQISTSVKKFGTGSMYFDGTGDYLTIPNNDALNFGAGDFTIEMWMYAQNLESIPMFFHKGASTSTGWFFQTSTTTLYFGQLQGPATTWSVSLSNNTWYHIALTRVGSVLNVFINGVSQGAQTVSGANASIDNTAPLLIGRFVNGSYQFQGYLDEYRITKGVARYTVNFTPPTKAFPDT